MLWSPAFEHVLAPYREIVFCDAEYYAPDGHHPIVICLVYYLWRIQEVGRLWLWGTSPPTHPPFPIDRHTLFVAHNATAELSVFHALRWPLPAHVLDTYVEARCAYNGRWASFKLGDVARNLGIAFQSKEEKKGNQSLAQRGGPYTEEERQRLLEYCFNDTMALPSIVLKLSPHLTLPYYLFRGRYMRALSVVEARGLPIDRPNYELLRTHKDALFARLRARTERDIGPLWEGDTFSQKLLQHRLLEWGIREWPRTPTGLLSTADDVLELMGRRYPPVEYLRQTRKMLNAFRLFDFSIGEDGCNRFSHIAFRTVTGRNAPSTKASLFQAAKCFRFLAKPLPEHGFCYIDWSQQEFLIHAVLAQDLEGLRAYRSGDPYMAIAIATGLAPPGATKDTHPAIRDVFKIAVLGMGYGMKAQTLADTTGLSYGQAEALLYRFHQRFSFMHDFDEKVLQLASVSGHQRTRLQWHRHIRRIIPGAGEDRTPGVATRESVRNFPIQANAAEMFRWAVVYAVEAGLPLVLLMHDAVMVHALLRDLKEVVQETRACMAKASRMILQGEELRTSAEGITAYPDRYRDPKGAPLWGAIRDEMLQLTGIDIDLSNPVPPNATTSYPSIVGR